MNIDTELAQLTASDEEASFDFEEELFRLPPRVTVDPRYVLIHKEFVKRLKNESAGLTMNTIQTALVERIANGYVLMRWHEDNPGNWIGINTEKDFTLNWRALVTEFNKVLSTGQEKHWAEMKKTYRDIMTDGLRLIADPETRKTVREHYIREFSNIGE